MPINFYRVTGITMALFGVAVTATAAPDRFKLTLGAQEYWDSNFARNANVDSEHYTRTFAALAFNERVSKQRFSLSASGSRYDYAEREDLDANLVEGAASWRSDWSPRIKTAIDWTRDAYVVDRLEFADKDVVTLENLKGQVTLDLSKYWGITLGARQAEQSHSNDLREVLDFDEDEWFAATTYTTANKSSLSLRLRDGERLYLLPFQEGPDGSLRNLDFEYRQLEIEGTWALTRKTQVGFTIGRFKREGDVNEGTGTQALIDLGWAISEKLKLTLSYSQSEPAVGETSDSPSDVRTGKALLTWEPSSKWQFSMAASHSNLSYLARPTTPARDEKITSISPLVMTYRFSDRLNFHIDSQWVDRESPLLYRDYDYALATVGFNFSF
jgi:hypothetical protein